MSERKPYPSDLSDARWALIEPTLTAWRKARLERRPTGQPAKVNLHDVFDALLYINRTGIPWKYLPHDFPGHGTVYFYYAAWRDEGILAQLNHDLTGLARVKDGRKPEPTASVIDTQSVKTWEADFGRTWMLGNDPVKHRLAADLPVIWEAARNHFHATPDITGSQLFDHVLGLITDAGWAYGASHAGHLVGEFPHERINGDDIDCYVTHGNDGPMRRLDAAGHPCHWILEIHLVDSDRSFGGFYEHLLDI
ncbi:transposase [Streptomyces adustus]|uniref:transposase n=1 Tax=Streptomyces adustus TaxID=1609272 RepID=UPI003B75BD01